jgi:hypothetical protein
MKKLKINSIMSRHLNKTMIILAMILLSCASGNEKNRKTKLIPVKELVSILTDVHIANALLTYPNIRSKFSAKDSVSNYIEVIESHGYTKERMDATMNYYFTRNPKKLEKIYDQVLGRLSEIEARLKKEELIKLQSNDNLWTGSQSYSFPGSGATNPFPFEIPIKDTGTYVLKITATIFPDDESLNPKISLIFSYPDSTGKVINDPWDPVFYPKDGIKHEYTLSRKLSDQKFTSVRGWLMNHDPKDGLWQKHATIEKISLTRKEWGK